ncbi:hypothetical protein F511_43017 [Dorcoceras hygrometricum]|uniref:CCHC-type domain-containing protein n=1 Tax=Dorcoceras hygrometricum TaxID=472368 RepID=A0A2Z7CHX1_9LAMI|nr:hypothetical protein F511_43017 [Dorcoceras hygrometricum]
MPPRRGKVRTTRRTAEESRAPVSGEGIQQTEVADVTRLIGELESVLSRFRPTTGRTFQPVQDASQSFHSPQRSQQANRRKFRPRGKQFKKGSNTSSSGSVSSSGSGFGGGVTCGQCGGRHMTSQCHGVQGSCHNCGQPGHFRRVCPLLRGQTSNPLQQGSAVGYLQRPQQAQEDALTGEQAEETPVKVIAGNCSIFDFFSVRVLFDTGASHSFIFSYLCMRVG